MLCGEAVHVWHGSKNCCVDRDGFGVNLWVVLMVLFLVIRRCILCTMHDVENLNAICFFGWTVEGKIQFWNRPSECTFRIN